MVTLDIPSRITQSWIERTVPGLNAAEYELLLEEMRARNWTDGDIAERVMPYAPRGEPAHVAESAETAKIELSCPRGHINTYSVNASGSLVECRCPRCKKQFVALANVVCRALSRERYSRTRSDYVLTMSTTTKVSAIIRIRYTNPYSPPPERLFQFVVRGTGGELQVRSG
jgi:hypothetical protein